LVPIVHYYWFQGAKQQQQLGEQIVKTHFVKNWCGNRYSFITSSIQNKKA